MRSEADARARQDSQGAAGSPAPSELAATDLPSLRSWAVWAVGVTGFALAVMQRTTFGAAGLEGAERYGVSAGALSGFVFLQVTVFLVMQLPAGLLVDRFGARAVLVAGSLSLAAGQALLASTGHLWLAVLARVAVGLGDAVMVIAVLALVPRWFPERQVPLVTQLTTILCQLGQVLTVIPFLGLLQTSGWGWAFGAAAAASGLGAVATALVVRDAPPGSPPAAARLPAREVTRELRAVWRRPGTRLAFASHLGTQFSGMVFAVLWGIPYLITGQGLSSSTASALITLLVGCTIVIGPVMGVLTRRHPLRRSWLVLAVIAANAGTWAVVLAWPPPAPLWLLVVLVVVLASSGPGSVVGLDIARTSNPTTALGLAQSMVNSGGFLASLIVLQAMGFALSATGGLTPQSFRLAWLIQFPVWALAVVAILGTRRGARRILAEQGVRPRALREVLSRSSANHA